MAKTTTTVGSTGGFTVNTWTHQVPISRDTLYNLSKDCWPKHTRIGTKILILESPREWLTRMSEQGGAKLKQDKQP